MLPAGKCALYRAELRDAKLLGEIRVERDLRTPGIDEEGDFLAAVYAHVDHRQRIGLYELHTRACPVAMQFIGRLALETLQLRNVQCRILLTNQLVAAYVDALERSRCFLEIVAAIKRLGQHDLWIGVIRLQGYGFFQPFLRVVEPVGKQCDATQLEGCRIILRILSNDLRVKFASFGKFTCLKEPIRPNRFLIAWAVLSIQLWPLSLTATS